MLSCVNPPVALPEWDMGSMSYGLSHLAFTNEVYLDRLISHEKYLILDNSTDEGYKVDIGEYIELLDKVKPDEVVAPDVLGNTFETLTRTEMFLNKISETRAYKVMGVAQGTDKADWITCYKAFLVDPRIDVIGVPYDIEFNPLASGDRGVKRNKTRQHALNRFNLINILDLEGLLTKPIHLLGMNDLTEFEDFKTLSGNALEKVRSTDSTAPFAASFARRRWFYNNSGLKDWPRLDFDIGREEAQPFQETLIHNLSEYFLATQDVEAHHRVMAKWKEIRGL